MFFGSPLLVGFFGLVAGSLARTNRSLMFLALLLPLMSFNFMRGRVKLVFSSKSQLSLTILLHSLKLGLKGVMRKVEELVSVWLFCGICGVSRSSRSRLKTLLKALRIT